jgi:hypothetical protein
MIDILGSAQDEPAPSGARAAIVSFVIGEVYEKTWTRMCAPNWIRYARRIGADVILFKGRIDAGDVARSPAWQKLLILGLPWARRYERIIWLDSDIVINEGAPDILDYAGPVEKIGICEDCGRMSPAEAQVYLEGKTGATLSPDKVQTSWRTALRQIYLNNQTPPHETMFNTGVMVLSPAHHDAALRSIYSCPQISHLCEQPQLSHRLLEDDLAHILSPRFNWGLIEPIELIFNNGMIGDETPEFRAQVMHVIVRSQLKSAYFLHFYGAMTLLTHYADNQLFADSQLPEAAE